MPVIRYTDVPVLAGTGPDRDTTMLRKVIGSIAVDDRFQMPTETPSLSVTWVRLWGRLRRMVCHASDRAMYIIDGEGVFVVGDESPAHVAAGDFVLIPRGVPYEGVGEVTYLVINSPAYEEGTDIRDNSYDGPPQRAAVDAED